MDGFKNKLVDAYNGLTKDSSLSKAHCFVVVDNKSNIVLDQGRINELSEKTVREQIDRVIEDKTTSVKDGVATVNNHFEVHKYFKDADSHNFFLLGRNKNKELGFCIVKRVLPERGLGFFLFCSYGGTLVASRMAAETLRFSRVVKTLAENV